MKKFNDIQENSETGSSVSSGIKLKLRKRTKQILGQKYICTLMFIAASFTVANTWKQPKCPQPKSPLMDD